MSVDVERALTNVAKPPDTLPAAIVKRELSIMGQPSLAAQATASTSKLDQENSNQVTKAWQHP
eukprot:4240834-Prorocentrum_lima.AAC.1